MKMKRQIATGLACVLLMMTPAVAETTETAAVENEKVAIAYEGNWAMIEGAPWHNFEMYLPTGWGEYELVEDETAETGKTDAESEAEAESVAEEGLYYSAGNEDGTQALSVYWETVEEAADAAAMQEELALTHEDAAVVSIGNVEFVQYTDAEGDAIVLVLPLETDLYTFMFVPASDAEFALLADEMIATIVVYDAQTGDMLGMEADAADNAESSESEGDA